MDFATTDIVLAIAHHVLVVALAGVLAFELGSVRSGMAKKEIARLAAVDLWYGILAGAIIIVGFVRANFAAKAGNIIHTTASSGRRSALSRSSDCSQSSPLSRSSVGGAPPRPIPPSRLLAQIYAM